MDSFDLRHSFSWLVLASWLVLPGCQPSDGDPGGCRTAVDCGAGERCVDGACVPAPDAGGARCSDAECNDGNPCNGVESCGASGSCERGTPLPAGSPCDVDGSPATREFCVAGGCVPSRCGDGVVDAEAGEVCDDGNAVDGDGCDSCRFSCTDDADCDDGDACSGVETCDLTTHRCVPGTALADDEDCNGALGRCVEGVCRPRSCATSEECDDGNPCNGAEVCTATGCAAGPPLDCDDRNDCTVDRCDPAAASPCVHRLIDEDADGHAPSSLGICGDDCDDTNPIVYTGAVDLCDGVDNDCDGRIDEDSIGTWYVDCDGDGYAAPGAASVESCARPAEGLARCPILGGTWTTRSPASAADCNDANPAVSPGQTTPQASPITGAPPGREFDYDCDGLQTPTYTLAGGCTAACVTRRGFVTSTPCGEPGTFVSNCIRDPFGGCLRLQGQQTQTCL